VCVRVLGGPYDAGPAKSRMKSIHTSGPGSQIAFASEQSTRRGHRGHPSENSPFME
jgi:hypothetical protein